MLFRVLGPVDVRGAGNGHVDVGAQPQRRLLALLLARANTWVDAETAIAALRTEDASHSNVKTSVHHLRQLLPRTADGSPRINSRSGAYRLNVAAEELDAAVFEATIRRAQAARDAGEPSAAAPIFAEALALWRDEPYGGAGADLGGVVYEAVEPQARRLVGLLWTARYGLADALTSLGRHADAVNVLRPLAAEDPQRRAIWERLVAALHADGRRDEALTTCNQARRALGGEPGETLRALQARLLDEDDPAADETQRVKIVIPPPDEHELSGAATPSGPPPDVHRPPDEERPWTDWRVQRVRKPRRRAAAVIGTLTVLVILAVLGVVVLASRGGNLLGSSGPTPAASSAPTSSAVTSAPGTHTSSLPPGVSSRRPVPGMPAPGSTALLFGVGPSALTAVQSPLVKDANARLLTTHFVGPGELPAMSTWRDEVVGRAYTDGLALHLVIDDGSPAGAVDTTVGPACGRPYALSSGFLADVTELAGTFGGKADGPPLLVTVFDGVERYACTQSAILADAQTTTYYRALLGRYLAVREIFHRLAPNALVSLGWHAAQASYDDPATGGGLSMFTHFADAMRLSDFVTISAASPQGNVVDVRAAMRTLAGYAPVLLSYDAPATVADQDLRAMLTGEFLREVTDQGMFAWTFGSDAELANLAPTYAFVKDSLGRYARPAR